MPSMSDGLRPASTIALRTASQAIESVVRLEGRRCGVSPTPTMQYLSVSAPIDASLSAMMFADYCGAPNTALFSAANLRLKSLVEIWPPGYGRTEFHKSQWCTLAKSDS